jgi:uncharacterized cupredoxin-like copper-binding protein/glucose/arabinose dehydrogenase
MKIYIFFKGFIFSLILLSIDLPLVAQSNTTSKGAASQPDPAAQGAENSELTPETEDDYYFLISLPIPEGIILEIGGMATLPDGSLAVCTRRGEVWIISNPNISGNQKPIFKRFASGLHEPLGLAYNDGDIYVTQRGEITRLRDRNGDGQADNYDKIYSWPLSGNYHEYSYGPHFLPNGNMLVTLNLGWSNSQGHGVSLVPWRGWMLEITPEGKMTPVAAGLRSPAGFGANADGDIFYTENQGDWVASGRISHVKKGDFLGNVQSLLWSHLEGSPIKLKPEDIPNTGAPIYEIAKQVEGLKPPAVWLPHGILGISTSGIINDNTNGKFGPYSNQLFVGDQGQSKIMRVDLEKVKGVYQGVVLPFREGFSSGILRLSWGNDGSLFSGMTSRGWSATGNELFGLQRVVWTGRIPFEMKTVRAMPDGFEIEFTMPANKEMASDLSQYKITGFNYKYHSEYGSPVINNINCPIKGIVLSDDGLRARIVVDSLLEGYIHEISLNDIRAANGKSLLHNVAYYTLNNIPDGEKLQIASSATMHDHAAVKSPAKKTDPSSAKANSGSDAKSTTKMAKRTTEKPAGWREPDITINLGTKPGLKFDPGQIQVKAGSTIKVVFNNDDDMLHNFVLVMPGTAIEVGEMAMKLGLEGQEKNYIPQSEKVLYHTNLLQPHQKEAIYFVAPTEPGDYTFVCTVPGHFYSMQGILKVVK